MNVCTECDFSTFLYRLSLTVHNRHYRSIAEGELYFLGRSQIYVSFTKVFISCCGNVLNNQILIYLLFLKQ